MAGKREKGEYKKMDDEQVGWDFERDCRLEDELFNPLSEEVAQGSEKDREGFHSCSTFIKLFHIKTQKTE